WIGQLLPMAGSLAPQARVELLWTAAVMAVEGGGDSTALAARPQLGGLPGAGDGPLMHALAPPAISWGVPNTGDIASASRAASAALQELRSQDEPLWTALAAGTLGSMQTTAGLPDDALSNLREVRALGDRLDSAWLAAWSRTQLGIVAIMQDRLDRACELL